MVDYAGWSSQGEKMFVEYTAWNATRLLGKLPVAVRECYILVFDKATQLGFDLTYVV